LFLLTGAAVLFTLFVLPRLREAMPHIGRTNLVDIHTHFSLDPSVPQIVLDSQRIRYETPPLIIYRNDTPRIFLPADFLRNHIDPFVFWDEGAGVLFVSTLYDMLEFTPDSDFFLLNGSPQPLQTAIIESGGEIYLPASLVQELYPLTAEYREQYNIVVITTLTEPQTKASVSVNRADIHYWPGSRPVTAQLTRGDELILFLGEIPDYPDMQSEEDFVRVRTADGLLGYVHYSDIENLNTAVPMDSLRRTPLLDDFIDNNVYHAKTWQGTEKINLIWELIEHPDATRFLMQTPLHPSLTVVSPKWFRIDREGTHINSIASKEYVDWAHEQGVLVWPMVFDVWYTNSRLMLTDRNARQHVISQLIEFVELFNLDGINIDFEHLSAAEGPYKIQFLRELAIPMRQRGVVLSAAVKVPIPATAFYRRDLIGKTVDFVMVMTYDEHWATSPAAGANASLPFVRRGVENMLLEVPRDRLIMGLPFYNRVWKTVPATGDVSHYNAWGTNTTRAFFEENGGVWEWKDDIGSYFGEASVFYEGESAVFQVWLEDARSIQEKMRIFSTYDLAGIASWHRMLAIDEFFEVLSNYF
jgi:spore germination protein YaaH